MLKAMHRGIRALTLGLIASIALGCLSCLVIVNVVIQSEIDTTLRHRAEAVQDTIEHELARAQALAQMIAAEPLAQQLVAARDRPALLARYGPTFSTFSEAQGVRQFQFHVAPATSLARVHKPEAYGDDLSGFRHTVVEANRTGRSVTGIERGVAGLGLRAIEPVHFEGRRVGTVEIGLALDRALLSRLHNHDPSALYLFPADGTAVRHTTTVTQRGLLALLDEAARGGPSEGELDGRTIGLSHTDLTDRQGQTVGRVVVAADLTPYYEHRTTAWLVISIVTLIVLGLVIGIAVRANRDAAGTQRVLDDSTFTARLNRALQMAQDEPAALEMIQRAMRHLVPDRVASLLLADNSNAHLQPVLAPHTGAMGCSPNTPRACPAAASGQSQWFPDSDALDACPHLTACEGRCGASCHPVTVAGVAVGVLHVQHPADDRNRLLRQQLEQVAGRFGDKLTIVRAMSESETAARTDPLTGLLNRRSFRAAVHERLAERQPYSVAFADLDHFKRLNDTYGHDVGDRALRRFATLLQRTIGDRGVVCRQGGEEFVVFLPGLDPPAATTLCDAVRASLAQATTEGTDPSFTVSMGVASSALAVQPHTAEGFDEVTTLADGALLSAKETGRDRVVVAGALRQVA